MRDELIGPNRRGELAATTSATLAARDDAAAIGAPAPTGAPSGGIPANNINPCERWRGTC